MIVNDKRENDNMLPVGNIIQGSCFICKDTLYIKTNASEWIEQMNPNDCFCLSVDNGRLTKLDKETMVTPVETECNMITKDKKTNNRRNNCRKPISKYIVIAWTRYDDEVYVQHFDTKSEAQKYMETNYNQVRSNCLTVYYEFMGETTAKVETGQNVFLWQIKKLSFRG